MVQESAEIYEKLVEVKMVHCEHRIYESVIQPLHIICSILLACGWTSSVCLLLQFHSSMPQPTNTTKIYNTADSYVYLYNLCCVWVYAGAAVCSLFVRVCMCKLTCSDS